MIYYYRYTDHNRYSIARSSKRLGLEAYDRLKKTWCNGNFLFGSRTPSCELEVVLLTGEMGFDDE